jgi:hypothetical protein
MVILLLKVKRNKKPCCQTLAETRREAIGIPWVCQARCDSSVSIVKGLNWYKRPLHQDGGKPESSLAEPIAGRTFGDQATPGLR